jgi:hypothetical protein
MAVEPTELYSPRPEPTRRANLRIAEAPEAATYPQIEDEHLYSDYVLPSYDSEVDTSGITSLGSPQHGEHGTTYFEEWPMNDGAGTRYHILQCIADNTKSDMWVAKDTALSTQPTGINLDVAEELMSHGFNVLVKGPEIGTSLPQSQSAYNTHVVLDTMEQRGRMDAGHIAIEGYSRGAMLAFGTNAYAEQFGRQVVYSNLTDPCVAKLIKVFDCDGVKKGVTLPLDLLMLGVAVAKGMADPRRTKHFIDTVDPSPAGAVQFYRTLKPLLSGEAGMLAASTPEDMHATIAFFRRCRVNDESIFRRVLANRPGVRFVNPEGGHGAALDKRIIGNIAVRFGRLGNQLAEGRSPDELDYRDITYGLKVAA